jgi:hypothetical protein
VKQYEARAREIKDQWRVVEERQKKEMDEWKARCQAGEKLIQTEKEKNYEEKEK